MKDSLFKSYDSDNVFQKILDGKISAYRIFEDEHTLAFLDLFPRTRGQILVIPKRAPSCNILSLPPEDIGSLFRTVQAMSKLVEATFNPKGVMVMQFNGEQAGQTVFYVHVHVFPVYDGENLFFSAPDKALACPSVLEKVQRLLLTQQDMMCHV